MREPTAGPVRPTRMSRFRMLLVALLLAAGSVPALPGTAAACSCVSEEPRQLVAGADAVVWAEVSDAQVPARGTGRAHYLLEVDTVYKGSVTERVQVDSAASSAACGLEGIEAGRSYVFFLEGEGSPYTAGLCGGTGLGLDREQVRSVAGEPRPPGAAPAPGGLERLPISAYSYAGIGAGLLAALGAAAVWFSRRRSST